MTNSCFATPNYEMYEIIKYMFITVCKFNYTHKAYQIHVIIHIARCSQRDYFISMK